MVKRMTFKQFLFVLPLLIIVSIFSLYPIISSFVYTLFDYRINDQQYSKLYLSGSFNVDLFYQNADYIAYYLTDDISVAEGDAAAELTAMQQEVTNFIAPYKGATGSQSISGDEADKIEAFINQVDSRLTAVYNANPDVEFYHREDMPVLVDEMRRSFIEPNFIGGSHYASLLKDSRFWSALRITAIFTAVSVSIELVLGMALAMIMNLAVKGIGLIRTTALIPWAIPTAVSALIWSYLYDGSNGVVAMIFSKIGIIDAPQNMLLTSGGAMASAILADVWKTTPYMALLLLAGLQTIDLGLYESAAIDGSNAVQTFFRITLPLMKPSILVALLFRMLDAFRVYDLLAILTNGGPGGATETLSIYAYKLMIGQSNYGYGSVVVVAMFVCVALIAFFFVKVMGAEVVSNED